MEIRSVSVRTPAGSHDSAEHLLKRLALQRSSNWHDAVLWSEETSRFYLLKEQRYGASLASGVAHPPRRFLQTTSSVYLSGPDAPGTSPRAGVTQERLGEAGEAGLRSGNNYQGLEKRNVK
ncbi:hypothetical protein EYF80_046688 [Liparis tanakae]|uniref:Uncharacterized protein n=1 Tax=Liparis tanakae TaxID=230148 RepID=A0A4Z2FPH2_9TELE|nr:hypothetical protein EYF80_046688 [Liparis tanakae]